MIDKMNKFFFVLLIVMQMSCNKNEERPAGSASDPSTELGAATSCSCVIYVKNVLEMDRSKPTANASDWGKYYSIPNYYEVSADPQPGDIIVLDKGYSWADAGAGHIAFVKSYYYKNDLLYVVCHGAKQQSGDRNGAFNECGCINVDDLELKDITKSDRVEGKVRFYRNNAPKYCASFSVKSMLEYSGNLNFDAVYVGSEKTLPLRLVNDGGSAIKIQKIAVPDAFQVTPANFSIEPRQTQEIQIKFVPRTAGNFFGNLTVLSDAANTELTVPVSGNGVSFVNSVSISSFPYQGNYVPCPQAKASYNVSGACAGYNYNTGTVTCRLRNPATEDGQLVFEIAKCDGSGFGTGKAYIKKGEECGIPYPSNGYSYNGEPTIIIKVPVDFYGTQNFTCIVDPDNYPSNYRFMGGTIQVTRN